ncbi:MAG TPA: sulfite exporter TauE/SafE family protein [Chitinophagaceae bacterium]|nr:sulfite exporter TauE/SafE family protein [Chitinophagaceae bacterium]
MNERKTMGAETIVILLIIGLAAGVLSGLVGVGGGIIIVPALVYFLGFSQHMAQGTSLGLLLPPVGILAVANYYKQGYIDPKVVTIMCLAFVIGAFAGSKFSLAISEEKLKKIFAVVLLLIAGKMLLFDK